MWNHLVVAPSFYLFIFFKGVGLLQWPLNFLSAGAEMTVENIYDKQTPTHKQVIWYSIHTKVVSFSGEEGNEQPSKQIQKERNIDINNKQTSIKIKPELSQWRPAASPSSFPIFQTNIHSIIITWQTFRKYGRLRLINLFNKVQWTTSKLFRMFWDNHETTFTFLCRPKGI